MTLQRALAPRGMGKRVAYGGRGRAWLDLKRSLIISLRGSVKVGLKQHRKCSYMGRERM